MPRIKKYFSAFIFFLLTYFSHAEGAQFSLSGKAYRDPVVYIVIAFATLVCLFVIWTSRKSRRYIWNLSCVNELTGLPMPKKFKPEAARVLKTAAKDEYSLISLDINNFRYITDSFGTTVANSVLVELTDHFVHNAPEGTLFCQNYQDNFTVLIKASQRPVIEDYVLNLTNIQAAVSKIFPYNYQIEFSAGVYVITDPSENLDRMIERANTARLTGKKGLFPKRITFFEGAIDIDKEKERTITLDMSRAYEDNEFVVYYQPKFNFTDSKLIGAEALVRWNHRTKGLIPPGMFIPLFEKNGFIAKIDKLVFENVCRMIDRWNKSGTPEHPAFPITISCNLSRLQLYNPNLVREYVNIASKYAIWPSQIEIELTESLMMDNKERLLKVMNEIKKAGFDISVDDFGSGFSSLALLKDIPANVIKLDKEFLATESEREQIIIRSVIRMAKELKLVTVAEGVETAEQSELLKGMGCDIAQGYYYAKPMSEKDFEVFLAESVNK